MQRSQLLTNSKMGDIITDAEKILQEFTVIEDDNDDESYDVVNNNEQYQLTKCKRTHTNNNDDPNLDIDRLMAMTPLFQGQDVVRIAARHLFLSKVKSQTAVKDVFFTDHRKDAYEYLVDNNWFDFETFSVLFLCQAISKCQDPYNLHALIDEHKCDHHLNDIADCPEWKKVGFALYTTLFPDLVKDTETFTPFRAYLNSDRKFWARQLYDKVRESKWLYNIIRPVITGKCNESEYNRDINILFVKLHLLDPTLVMPAYHYLQKALPDLNLELATTNYLGGPLDWKVIKNNVEAVMYKPLYQRKVPKVSFQQVDCYYGVELLEFVMKDPRELELLTDQNPDNRRTSTFKDRCFIM